MIIAIDLPKLRNAEYIQYVKDYLSIIQSNNPATLNVEAQYNTVKDMLATLEAIFITEQGSAITQDIGSIDLRRDSAITGFTMMVNAFIYHFDPATAKHAGTINRQLAKYGSSIARQNYQAETTIIDNLLADLTNKPDVDAAMAALNLTGWKKELEQANTAFNAAYLQRTQQIGAASKDTLFAKRLETNTAYYKLRDFIDSYYTINEAAEPYSKTTNELNALIEQYNTMMAGRVGDNKEEPPAPPTA